MRKIFKISVVFILVLSMITGMGLSAYTTDTDEAFNPVVGELEIVQDEQEDKSEEMPAEPGDQTDPQEGSEVGEPTNPEDPVDPEDPENPVDPENPDGPGDSENPVNPEGPENPPVDPNIPPTVPVPPTTPTANPSIYVEVSTDKNSYLAGETINYTIKIINTGDVGLESITLEDMLLGKKNIGNLEVEEEQTIVENFLIPLETSEETVSNSVYVVGHSNEIEVSAEATFSVSIEKITTKPEPLISVTAIPEYDSYMAGQTINYQVIIKNEGNVELENVILLDGMVGIKEIGNLAVGKEVKLDHSFDIPFDLEEEAIQNNLIVTAKHGEVEVSNETSFYVLVEPLMMRNMLMAMMGNPGDIFLSKVANQQPVGCREYEVTLSVSGNSVPGAGNVDVVFVIDNSHSMGFGGPSAYKQADNIAKHFSRVINGNNNATNYNRVALVTFSEGVLKTESFSTNNDPFNFSGNYYSASGSSNLSVGLLKAKEILDTTGRNSPDINKVIIIISDGLVYHGPNETQNSFSQVDADIAIEISNTIKGSGIIIGAINLGQTTPPSNRINAETTLKSIATTVSSTNEIVYALDTAYADPKKNNDLIRLFDTVLYSAGTDGIVTDIIDPRFEFIDFTTYDGAQPIISNGIDGKQTITWNVGSIILQPKILTYRIKAKPEYNGEIVQGNIPTNESATLSFTKALPIQMNPMYFTVPTVYVPAPLSVTAEDKTIVVGQSVNLNNQITITGGYTPHTVVKWYLTNDINKTPIDPTVSPIEDTQYTVVVADAYGFCKVEDTMWVKIQKGSINITKIVTDLKLKDEDKEFDIRIEGPDSKVWVVTLKSGEEASITGLATGTYTIKEIIPMNFSLVSMIGDGIFDGISKSFTVEINENDLDKEITITNKRTNDGWFYDDNEKINSFTVRVNNENSLPTIGKSLNAKLDYFIIPSIIEIDNRTEDV